MRYNNIAILSVLVLSASAINANAQELKGMRKHDASIANYSYSIPIVTSDTPATPGVSLKDDMDKGRTTVAPSSMPSGRTAALQDAMAAPVPGVYTGVVTAPSSSGIPAGGLSVGAIAPDFTVQRAAGGTLVLSNVLAKGPAIVMFTGPAARSQQQFELIQKNLGQFNKLGIQVLAVTPDNAMALRGVQQKYKFEILSDDSSRLARQYGAVSGSNIIPSMFSLDAASKVVAVQMAPSNGLFDLTQAATPLFSQVQPTIAAPALTPAQVPTADAMIQVPGQAPVAPSPDAPINQIANDPVAMDEAAPVMPAVPSPQGNAAIPPSNVPKIGYLVPPSHPDFVKQMNGKALSI